jgi:CRP/FNR family transcriptional regulator
MNHLRRHSHFAHKSSHSASEDGNACVTCALRPLSACCALEDGELDTLWRLARTVNFAPRELILQQDEPANNVFNITAGAVRIYKLLPNGNRHVLGFAIPGDFIGISVGENYELSADAMCPTTVCQFTRASFLEFLDTKPHFLRHMHAMATRELEMARNQIVILGRRTAEEKVAAFLIGLRDRWARIDGATLHIPLPMTRQDIGDFLGLTVETVSRMFTRLARKKTLVVTPEGVRLLDVAKLEAMTSY